MIEGHLSFSWFRPRYRLVPWFGPVVQQVKASGTVPPPGSPVPDRPFQRFEVLVGFTLTDMQQVSCTLTATDAKGNPATFPAGSIAWSVDSPTVVAVTPDPTGQTALLVAGGLGTATVSVIVSDPSGTTTAAGSLAVTVTGGQATNITIVPGTPSTQP